MSGSIPILHVKGKSLPEAWENSLVALYENGARIKTQYDRSANPPSIDATMGIEIEAPLSEPRIHRCFPGGLDILEEYRQEVLDGIKDSWIRDKNDPTDTRWEYTYHERLFSYSYNESNGTEKRFDQINDIIEKLSQTPYSRRAQAITWKVWEDLAVHDPACLQSVWCRILADDEGVWTLNMNIRFRSNDAYEAAFMNMFAFTLLQQRIADEISKRAGREVKLGRYYHMADSYHIYGNKIEEFEQRFLGQMKSRSFEDRTWYTEFAQPIFDEAKENIKIKLKEQEEKYKK